MGFLRSQVTVNRANCGLLCLCLFLFLFLSFFFCTTRHSIYFNLRISKICNVYLCVQAPQTGCSCSCSCLRWVNVILPIEKRQGYKKVLSKINPINLLVIPSISSIKFTLAPSICPVAKFLTQSLSRKHMILKKYHRALSRCINLNAGPQDTKSERGWPPFCFPEKELAAKNFCKYLL